MGKIILNLYNNKEFTSGQILSNVESVLTNMHHYSVFYFSHCCFEYYFIYSDFHVEFSTYFLLSLYFNGL